MTFVRREWWNGSAFVPLATPTDSGCNDRWGWQIRTCAVGVLCRVGNCKSVVRRCVEGAEA